jgi:predicted restriction endonuclease
MIYFKQTKLLNYLEPRLSYNKGRVLSITKWRKEVLAKDKNKCQNCFNAITDIYRHRKSSNEAHHIIARHHGGKNTINNGITLCRFCHDYFDMMYFKYGMDYFDIIKKKLKEKRVEEVRDLMLRQYLNHLLNIISY